MHIRLTRFDEAGRPTGADVLDARELTLHITDEQSRHLAQGLEVSVFTARGRIDLAAYRAARPQWGRSSAGRSNDSR